MIRLIEVFYATSGFPLRLSDIVSNLGTAKNFAKAISLCRGDVIMLSDQDDVWHSDKLESVERIFEAKPQLSLVFSNAELVDETLRLFDETLFDRLHFNGRKQRLVKSGRALNVQLRENLVCGCTLAFSKEGSREPSPLPLFQGLDKRGQRSSRLRIPAHHGLHTALSSFRMSR